ncbi:MAG: four helix bundle protein [Bacteroidetes bacterium]|nr:four helix bundle protein [Bacteroidota bacterium]
MASKIKSFEDLEIWKLSHSLVLEIYKITKTFPKSEDYILTQQIVRAAQSIPTNIAEGMGRFSKKEFIQFLIFPRGSVEETKYHLILAKDLGYLDEIKFEYLKNNYTLLGKKINALISSIKSK